MANRTHGTGSITQRSEGTWSLRYYAPGEDGKYRQVRETVKGSQAKAEKEHWVGIPLWEQDNWGNLEWVAPMDLSPRFRLQINTDGVTATDLITNQSAGDE